MASMDKAVFKIKNIRIGITCNTILLAMSSVVNMALSLSIGFVVDVFSLSEKKYFLSKTIILGKPYMCNVFKPSICIVRLLVPVDSTFVSIATP